MTSPNMDNMNTNNWPAAIMDNSKTSSGRRRVNNSNNDDDDDRNDINLNNPVSKEDCKDADSIADTTSVASITSTGGYSGDCSSSEESCPTSSGDKIGLVIDIAQKLCDETITNMNRKRKHHSTNKESTANRNGNSTRGKHDRKRRRRNHDIPRRYGSSNTDSSRSGNDSGNVQLKRRRRSCKHKIRSQKAATICNDMLLQPSLLHPEPSPIHPDIDPSITKLVKNWHGRTPTGAAAAAAAAAFGTDQLSSHDQWQTIKKGKELLLKQQQCVSDSLCAISDVLQTFLEAVENNPSSSSEMATETGPGNSGNDGIARRKTKSAVAIRNRYHDESQTKLNKLKQLPVAATSTATQPHTVPPSSTDNCTNKSYMKPSTQHLKDTSKHGHQHRLHPNLISDVVTYSDQPVSLEHALDLTSAPRLLLEASPPHRVIHANAAFSKLIILDDQKKRKNTKTKKRSTKEQSEVTNIVTTSTATCDWIQKQNTPPPSFVVASPTVTSSSSSSSATSLLAAAAVAAWKNRTLQDAIEQMIPEHVSGSDGGVRGQHGIERSHRYIFTCYPVCISSFSGSYAETDSSSSSSGKVTSSSSSRAAAAAAANVTASDNAVESNKDRTVHHVKSDNGIGSNERQSHVSHYLIEGRKYDASSSFDTNTLSSTLGASDTSSKLALHSRAVG